MENIGLDDIAFHAGVHERKRAQYLELVDGVNRSQATDSDRWQPQFWDVVVLTAIDQVQRTHYERQISKRLEARLIPQCTRYLVIADPPGPKIGCGGATMVVLAQLASEYGARLDTLRILLIHAGGYSKRLPHHSANGKIFAPVPFPLRDCGACCTMLEMKLIMFVDFARHMAPGVFLTCADDIEFFESRSCDLTRPGFTALAHPNPPHVGLTHGVFVLLPEDAAEAIVPQRNDRSVPAMQCRQFLHKPTAAVMKDKHALLPNDQIFTDSSFFFDAAASRQLLAAYNALAPLRCEIDAYGDFLQPLGNEVDDVFLKAAVNDKSSDNDLARARRTIYEQLRSTPLHVLPLVPSLFLHIGTQQEYLEHFCSSLPRFGFPRRVLTRVQASHQFADDCTLVHVLFDAGPATVASRTVIEHSSFEDAISIGSECILSDIHIERGTLSAVPNGVMLQTLPVTAAASAPGITPVDGAAPTAHFVTNVFGSQEDLKSCPSSPADVQYFGRPLLPVAARMGLEESDLWQPGEMRNLWNAQIFPVADTNRQSLCYAADLLAVAFSHSDASSAPQQQWRELRRLSFSQALQQKDVATQADIRAAHQARIEKIAEQA